MATVAQLSEWIVANKDLKGTPNFNKVALAYQHAKEIEGLNVESRKQDVRREKAMEIEAQRKSKPATIGETIKGVGEAGLSLGTGATTGALGAIGGGLYGIGESIAEGEFGTRAGTERFEKRMGEGAQALTYAPTTQAGQEITAGVAEFLAPLEAFGGLTGELQAIGALAKASRPVVQAKAMEIAPKITAPLKGLKSERIPMPTEAVKAAENLGIDVMTSDVIKPQTFVGKSLQMTGERVPLVGTGGMRETQQTQRVQAIKNVAQDFKADSPLHDIETSVMDDLAKTRGDEVSKYVQMKKDIFDKTSGAELVTPKANMAIDTEINSLRSLNSPTVQPVIDKLESFKGSIQGQDINNVERLRKILSEDFKSPDLVSVRGEGEKAVSKIYGALREDMGDHIKQFGDRRDSTKWSVANKKLSLMMGELENNALKYTLKKGNLSPEVVSRMLYSKSPSDLNLLYKNLSPEGRASARSAVLGKIYQNSLDTEGQVSTAKFLTGLDKMDESAKVFFKGADKETLDGLKKALALTRRAEEAKVLTNTGQQLSIPAMYGAAGAIGGWGGLFGLGTVGAIARLYESPAVRNALMRLGKAKGDNVTSAVSNLNNVTKAVQEQKSKARSSQPKDLLKIPESTKESKGF